MPPKQGEEGNGNNASLVGLLGAVGRQLIPVLLTAGSLIGFVAFAGGVIVWTRFSAAKVPADQAVNAVPRDELVAIGSALLLLFGFFGVLALATAFLIDRGGRATPGMARGLLCIFLLEGAVTILIADGISTERRIAAIELLALSTGLAGWVTLIGPLVKLEDDLPTKPGERPGPRPYSMFLLADPDWPQTKRERRRLRHEGQRPSSFVWAPLLIAAAGLLVGAVLVALDHFVVGVSDTALRNALSVFTAAFALAAVVALFFEGPPVRALIWEKRRAGERAERDQLRRREGERERDEDLSRRLRRLANPQLEDEDDERQRRRESLRLLNDRPMRLSLRAPGTVIALVALVPLPFLCWELVGEWWVAASIGAAALLTVSLWRIATLSAERIVWFGVAVFLSVPLFGTLSAMARNVANPQVQPMALIRESDGPDEAIQGLYVAEADDRVYFATVATEGCENELTPHSGRLAWVPKSEVVAMSVGPLQSVKDAGTSALEMAYALTPAVETPAGGKASLTGVEKLALQKEEAGEERERRLEDGGPAVRPYYGAGFSLSNENASPGEVVTLRMSAPNRDVEGFGATRSGRTVRVGGVRANILKEKARDLGSVQFLRTLGGKVLKLAEGGVLAPRRDGGAYVSLAAAEEDDIAVGSRLMVRLADPRAIEIDGRAARGDGAMIELEEGAGVPRLADPQMTVVIKGPDGSPISEFVEPRPLGQAWHEREIRFEVPENATTGAITVECSQLAGQPLLRVAHAPEARVAVRMEAGSSRVTFDSDRSTDSDDEEISRRWEVAGLRRGNLPSLSTDLPARLKPYPVSLTVTDESGAEDTVELRVLRLPAALFPFAESELEEDTPLERARETLLGLVEDEAPAAIEIEGHADDPGTRQLNARLSLQRAEYVRNKLLYAEGNLTRARIAANVPVRTLGYGEGCPIDANPGRRPRNRRVDVFVLGRGVSMTPPSGCHPLRFTSSRWKLRPRCPQAAEEPTGREGSAASADGSLIGGLLRILVGGSDGSGDAPPPIAGCVEAP